MINLQQLCIDLKNCKSSLTVTLNKIIKKIYGFLFTPSFLTKKLIETWELDFKNIYGNVDSNLSSNNKLNIEKLFSYYSINQMKSISDTKSIQYLFFSIQTLYSLLIKVIMKNILLGDYPISDEEIIIGNFAEKKGIINYCNFDSYTWPIYELSHGFSTVFFQIKDVINNYKISQTEDFFVKNNKKDYIKQIYESIIPKELRHALGEYYTPDWLAEATIKDSMNYCNNKIIQSLKVLDPTCGSGTFLIKMIEKKRQFRCSLNEICSSIIGIDINPLAVLTAKSNYIISILDLLDENTSNLFIPIFNADVLDTTIIQIDDSRPNSLFISTQPIELINYYKQRDQFYIRKIHDIDIIIGNPPWVNWEYISEEYKNKNQNLWIEYGLFNIKGLHLSFSKEDISVLITYVVMDRFLKKDGILAFIIRQATFKSAQNGVGFRKFLIKDTIPVKVLKVDDLSKIKVFENATTCSSIIYAQKGIATEYPVPYYVWNKKGDIKRLSINSYSELSDVSRLLDIHLTMATPTIPDDTTSLWMNIEQEKKESIKKVIGNNDYKARTGVFTGGANAVYWINIKEKKGDNIVISNITEKAKRKVKRVDSEIEKDFVYPLLKGSDISKWKSTYTNYIVVPHTRETKMWPIPQESLKQNYPNTYYYLLSFKSELDSRKGFAGWEKQIQKEEFHAVLRIGDYTFSPYKVVWKYIAQEFICAVVSSVNDYYLGEKILIPNEKVMYISTSSEEEAYYLCGILSSSLVSDYVKSFMNPTSISAHVLNKIKIFKYDQNNQTHTEIAKICKQGHLKGEFEMQLKIINDLVDKLYEQSVF